MEIVKDKDQNTVEENRKAKETGLINFFKRKAVCEEYAQRLSLKINVYSARYEEIKESLKPSEMVEAIDLKEKIQQASAEYQMNHQSYEFIERRIKELSEGDEASKYSPEDFEELKKEAEKLAENEFYASSKFTPKDQEFPIIIGVYDDAIQKMEIRIKELDSYGEKISHKEAVELFDLQQRMYNLKMINSHRIEEYQERFLPQYKKDMQQYHAYFDQYMNRARQIVKHNISPDPRLMLMLQQYQENKDDKQYRWQFWTALRHAVDSITLTIAERIKEGHPVKPEFKSYGRLIIPAEKNVKKA